MNIDSDFSVVILGTCMGSGDPNMDKIISNLFGLRLLQYDALNGTPTLNLCSALHMMLNHADVRGEWLWVALLRQMVMICHMEQLIHISLDSF